MTLGAQIVWPDEDGPAGASGASSAGSASGSATVWGDRFRGALTGEGEPRHVLSVTLPKGQAEAIGVNLHSSNMRGNVAGANSTVQARVTFSAGRSGPLTFDCDWRGGFVVHASKLEIEFVPIKARPDVPFQALTDAILSATAGLRGVRPAHPPTLTFLPYEAITRNTFRSLVVPPMARRVSLLARYGQQPLNGVANFPAYGGGTGPAPLSQIYLEFMDEMGGVDTWIDAFSAREALFGAGVPIPEGATQLELVNGSSETLRLGAVFHLGV